MFVHDVLVIMTNQLEGMVIEEKSGTAAAEDDLEASIRAFEGDFYTPVLLYLGEFKEVAALKRSFQFERRLFEFAKSRRKTSALFTAHALLPLYLLSHLPEGEKACSSNHCAGCLKKTGKWDKRSNGILKILRMPA